MKKVLFLLVVLFTTAMSVNAQSCQKSASAGASCCAKKMASASTADIDAALAADKSVEKRVCAESGKVSYFQKSVDGANTTWNEVAYDANSKGFTKVAAASMERASDDVKVSKACSAQEKAACEKAGKSCCKKGTSACTAKKPEGSK